uniref:Carboxyl-terminal protease (Ctp) n=1 Tax=uncultured bacterium contig00043 TaxID=1181530 RepID=A0A806JZI2_9BACT|nr:carboxyl-terminal protease (ctp) [uncultured bacterium contig00043]
MSIKDNKKSFTWVWIIATTVLCILFTFALIPGAAAQGNGQLGTNQTQQNRRYQSIIQNVFNFIQNHYVEEVDSQVLFEGAMNGMFNALDDPYSSFLAESDMKDMNDTTQGSFGGVGLNITQAVGQRPDGKPRYVEVVSPIEDTPGWRAGINPGDFISEINGIATDTLTMDEVLGMLRGTPGEDVKLVIKRGDKMEFPVTITRAIIEVPTAKHAMIGNTGYLKLLTFTPMTAGRAREAIAEFQTKNYKSVILDLRNNYGGLLNSAVEVASIFLDGGLVVSTKSRIPSENREFNTRRGNLVPADIPVIVLINRGSASASEIVAGALKDRGRAYLVGENTFGKGSVQQVYPLETVGFKLTTARYYTPSDVNIDKIGIPPDREVSFPEYTDADAEHMNQLINANKIPEFVKQNPKATTAQVEAFAQSLEKEYNLNLSLLKRMIRNELNRTTIAPVYDLEYDVQLQEALNILRSGIYPSLMENFKTLKALQEEAEKALPVAS